MDRITAAVAVVNGRATTTSLKIAEVFGKRHADVIRAIKSIETPDNFNERNFALVEYTDAKGEKRPAYQITRDGFTLLAMGFTGEKAMQFKIAYIEAFNAMEEQLRQHPGTARPLPEPPALFRHEYRGARVATTAEVAAPRQCGSIRLCRRTPHGLPMAWISSGLQVCLAINRP